MNYQQNIMELMIIMIFVKMKNYYLFKIMNNMTEILFIFKPNLTMMKFWTKLNAIFIPYYHLIKIQQRFYLIQTMMAMKNLGTE